MSRSNYDKPFYVDVGTSIAAVRCASNHDVVVRYDHVRMGKCAIEEAERICDRLNAEFKVVVVNDDILAENAKLKEEIAKLKRGNEAAMREALYDAGKTGGQ